MLERIKNHVKEHKIEYACAATAIVSAGFTYAIMRGTSSRSISDCRTVATNHSNTVIGKKIVMKDVSLISSNRKGSPSWVIQCLETGNVFRSQRDAAINMGINPTNVSKQLNGHLPTAEGFTFERICLAA